MKTFTIALLALLWATSAFSQNKASYKVSVTPKLIKVEAQFFLQHDERISAIVHGTPELPDGEASFMENIKVKDADGKDVAVKSLGMGDWKLSVKNKEQQISLSYDIKVKHDQYNWDNAGGVDEVFYRTPEGLFFTGYALFIHPYTDDLAAINDVSVSFSLPAGWKASTPWVNNGANSFTVQPDIRFLLNNCLFLGTHQEESIAIGDFQVKMAIGQQFADSKPLFVALLEKMLGASMQMFGGCLAKNYFVVVNENQNMTDGGAFRNSFSQVIQGEVNANGRAVWGHTMAHEAFHLWNGLSMMPQGSEDEWFKEGFTDYCTLMLEARTGLLDEATIFKRLEKNYTKYIIAKRLQGINVSLREAGKNKQANRFLVYGGGVWIALALDAQMREATAGAKGMDDLMRSMYEEFGKTGKRYQTSDILRVANAVAGQDFTSFFQKYVSGTEMLDITPYLAKMGLQMNTFVEEAYINRHPSITAEQGKILKSIWGF